jgi:hypothetical protein
MAGQRMAAPLQALRAGHSAWTVGVLLALFAARRSCWRCRPGRLADRLRLPPAAVRIAVGLSIFGVACALAAWLSAGLVAVRTCSAWASAMLSGAGTNVGVIVVLRAAGLLATRQDRAHEACSAGWAWRFRRCQRAGAGHWPASLIDLGGFAAAYGALLVHAARSLCGWWRQVPRQPRQAHRGGDARAGTRPLGRCWPRRGCKRSAVHQLAAVGQLGRAQLRRAGAGPCERGYSRLAPSAWCWASSRSRSVIRGALHHPDDRPPPARGDRCCARAMVMTAAVFAHLPVRRHAAWLMAGCAHPAGTRLALGAVQPMIMSTLHQMTPPDRHGEAIAHPFDDDQPVERIDAAAVRRAGRGGGGLDPVLGDGCGGGCRQRAGQAHRAARTAQNLNLPSAGGAGSAGAAAVGAWRAGASRRSVSGEGDAKA